MAEPTLAQIFGTGATQDANTLTIQKSALVAVGLTAGATNRAEALLTAILLLARNTLTENAFNNDIDFSIYMQNGFSSFTTRGTNNDAYRVDQITVNLAKPDTSATIDPDDY